MNHITANVSMFTNSKMDKEISNNTKREEVQKGIKAASGAF